MSTDRGGRLKDQAGVWVLLNNLVCVKFLRKCNTESSKWQDIHIQNVNVKLFNKTTDN